MRETPVHQDPGRGADPWPEWMDDPAYLACRAEDEDPGELDLYEDPDNAPPPDIDDAQLEALIAEAREITADQARSDRTAVLAAIAAVVSGRRGPGMPGSAQAFPGQYASPAAGFASGEPLDTAPGCRRPSTRADFEHTVPYEAGGRTCLCNGNPKCRFDHRLKQDPRWNAEQLPNGEIRWTTPSGRHYLTEPTRYPI